MINGSALIYALTADCSKAAGDIIARYPFKSKFDHLNNAVEIKSILSDIKVKKLK